MTQVNVPLFLKPSDEMELEGRNHVDPGTLERKGDELRERLYRAARTVRALQEGGWEMAVTLGSMYDLSFTKVGVETEAQAREELARLGVDSDRVDIYEFDEEE